MIRNAVRSQWGVVLEYTCLRGHTFEGDHRQVRVKCRKDGSWSAVPSGCTGKSFTDYQS